MRHLRRYFDISEFDEITRFRLMNAIFVGIAINLLMPVLVDLRGELLTASFISFIMIVTTLSVKSNKYLVRLTKAQLFKLGIVIHTLFIIGSTTYFYDPLLFVYIDSFIAIAEVAIFTSYSVKLNTYLAEYFPEKMEKFQVIRNSLVADAALVGLFLTFITTTIGTSGHAIVIYLIFNVGFSIFLYKNWNFIDEAMARLYEARK